VTAFAYRDGELAVEAISLADVAAQFGTPCFVYSRAALESAFREFDAAFDGADACFAPVLTFAESRRHPHVVARHGSAELGGIAQPAAAPRFDRTPGGARTAPPERGAGGALALRDWGFDAQELAQLRGLGVGWTGATQAC